MKTTFNIDENGYYGEFGGAFVPKELAGRIEELKNSYADIIGSEEFQLEYRQYLQEFVGRPTPLYFARRLSEQYHCKVYLKREDLNHTGAHKINNAIGQVLLARKMGKTRIIAETGAGQHGVAAATVCALMDMPCTVYMGQTDIERQNSNVQRIKMLGATVHPVTSGTGTLNDAVNEALAEWVSSPDQTYYLMGSAVGPHPYPDLVARLQSVISEEIQKQLFQREGRIFPDYLIACIGGGSNASGTFYHYLDDEKVHLVLAEAGGKGIASGENAATLSIGRPGLLHGFKTLVLKDEQGQVKEAYSISAGLDYPGIGPMFANLATKGRATVIPVEDEEALEAAFELSRLEGIIPALESSHAIAVLKKMNFRQEDVVVVTVSGRGDKDLPNYISCLFSDKSF